MFELSFLTVIKLLRLNSFSLVLEMLTKAPFMESLALILITRCNLLPYSHFIFTFLFLGTFNPNFGVHFSTFIFFTLIQLINLLFHKVDVILFHLNLLFNLEIKIFDLLIEKVVDIKLLVVANNANLFGVEHCASESLFLLLP